MTPDQINGLFEGIGGFIVWINVYCLYRDKEVKGVSTIPTFFFTCWGFWNLYYYSVLQQPWSLLGGAGLVFANTVWWWLMVKYRWRNKHDRS